MIALSPTPIGRLPESHFPAGTGFESVTFRGWKAASLPAWDERGFLPEGIHDCPFGELEKRFATNPQRARLWEQFRMFTLWAVSTNKFSYIYLGGGYISSRSDPRDIDVILQTRDSFGPDSLRALEPFFSLGLNKISQVFSVHLHFYLHGFPGIIDFRSFFQYLSPEETKRFDGMGNKKGIVRIDVGSVR